MRSETSRALITRNMGYLTEFKLLSGGVVLEGGHGEHVCEKGPCGLSGLAMWLNFGHL